MRKLSLLMMITACCACGKPNSGGGTPSTPESHAGSGDADDGDTGGTSGGNYTGPAIFLPDPSKTPGVLCSESDPNFQEYRYSAHIPYCRRNISMQEKMQVAEAYGVPREDFDQYEFDHFIPLSIGGSNSPENLYPQRLDAARVKDVLEMALYQKISAGMITQAEAVQQIRDWRP